MAERAGHSDYQEDYDDDEETNNNGKRRHNTNNKSMFRVGHETYIVQIPREQIYRVPPPENAEFVKRYGNPVKEKGIKGPGGGTRRRCAYWLFSIIFALTFMISVIVCVNKFTLSPNPPTFSINHLLLVNQSSFSSKKNAFLVIVETRNPNIVNEIRYKEGRASLTCKGKQIGKGPFPALENQPPAHSDALNVTLLASSSKDDDFNAAKSVIMNLSINIPLNLKTWLWTTTLNFVVNCDFQADAIGPRFQIQSQTCHVIHNQQP